MADQELSGVVTAVRTPDGGWAEFTDPTPVKLGDDGALVSRQVTYRHDGDSDQPPCVIVFEVRDGAVVCSSITLAASSEKGIRTKDLRALRLDELAHDVYAYVGVMRPNPNGKGWVRVIGWGSFQQDRKAVEGAGKRRKITPDFLKKVAAVHGGAPAGERLRAVIDAFPASDGSPLSERQALRYIAQARKEGLIDG